MSDHELILYRTEDGKTQIYLKAEEGTVWLTQAEIAKLFQRDRTVISKHISNILEDKELKESSVCAKFARTASDGKEYEVVHHNLDMILAIGYRIKSERGIQFRQWATTTLKEYLIKGFVLNDERLKDPRGWDYFNELLERIREIRASEKLFYQKVKDIYAQSVDYDPHSDQAQTFFKTVQNKMLFAITHHTAAELLRDRSNPSIPNMGLTSWKGTHVLKNDIMTAKNYLAQEEVTALNRIVTMFLDFAEETAQTRKTMAMKDWENKLNDFLKFNEKEVLTNLGNISHEQAERLVHERYTQFDNKRRAEERIIAEREAEEELKQMEKDITSKK